MREEEAQLCALELTLWLALLTRHGEVTILGGKAGKLWGVRVGGTVRYDVIPPPVATVEWADSLLGAARKMGRRMGVVLP